MKNYLCVLGRDPKLSLLEIISYCKRKNIQYTLHSATSLVAHFSFSYPPNIKDLGGTVRIAEETTMEQLIQDNNKINFALTTIDSKDILQKLRTQWKEQGIKAMQKYASMRDIPPSKAKNLDFDLIVYRNVLYKVISISNPKEYKERDETRPAFDAKRVISIRLAKILLNLAQAKNEIMDPFCGTGTILQEALLMGYNVKGIDLSTREAQQNLKWLGQHQHKIKLYQGDVQEVLQRLSSIETVVTEPYLGPFLKKLPSEGEANRIVRELEPLYKNVLTLIASRVKGKIVIIVPQFRTRTKTFSLNIAPMLEKAGLLPYSPLPNIKIPYKYEKLGAHLDRLIYILEPKRKT